MNLPAIARLSLPILWLALPAWAIAAGESHDIQFNRDIRPILSDNCFQCHGPDARARKGELRLDSEAAAFARREEGQPIIRGKPDESELVRRITATDADERMPPPESGKKLSPEQVELLRRWIEQGAKWERHWSFIPPQRPAPPHVSRPDWMRNPIDAFALSRLDRELLAPSPQAERTTLLRRVTFDLTGLPPTPEEIADFLEDSSPDAYERVIDRLLAAPRYGERMAVRWLDAARYADTNGYQSDGERSMWRWRDWVIDAFNRDMPFDQFTIEQLAGDLLPNSTLEQRIATGFNRNHRGNAEGGIIPEEYAVEYVVDRVETTCTVWLGLTMGCVRCHDHKFDPFTQRDFYSLFAFFNSVPEKGRAIKFGNSPPMIAAPTKMQQDELARLRAEAHEAEAEYRGLKHEIDALRQEWESQPDPREVWDWYPTRAIVGHLPLDGSLKTQGTDWASIAVDQGEATFDQGRVGEAFAFDGKRAIVAGDVADFGYFDKFTLAAWVKLDGQQGGTIISRMTDVPEGDGYQLAIVGGKLQLNLVKRWLDDSTRVESEKSIPPGEWRHIAATYDGSRYAAGIRLFIDGQSVGVRVNLDELNQPINAKEPLRVGGGGGPGGRFRGLIDEVRLYNEVLARDEINILATPENINSILKIPVKERRHNQQLKLEEAFVFAVAPEPIRKARLARDDARHRSAAFQQSFPTVMVMEELEQPRAAHILLRGQYDQPGARVERGVPVTLDLPFPKDAPRNRLGLAQWLVDPCNPLAARVTVNRFWQGYFGAGLVKTAEDFGSQGEWPTHPELLDWLATEFSNSSPSRGPDAAWGIKKLQRQIVTSSTYRQSSRVSKELLVRDPENRLLARGPRMRLSAEMIRDQALAASGLLVERIGGPSVMPYQPPGLWTELTGGDDYKPGTGADLYRRSLYTFWKRTIAPPTMLAFDASSREFCTVRETRTNTPLQALALLNEQTFALASVHLARRILAEKGATPNARLALVFTLTTGRAPAARELEILTSSLVRSRERYLRNSSAANDRIGELAQGTSHESRIELAAWSEIAAMLLNLDETVTKE